MSSKERPLFSIVTVCLNPGHDLDKTVHSILAQTYDGFELVIKDGVSDDGTCSKQWCDGRIRFFSMPDEGIFEAMNQALGLCRGEYVIFMNAGDYFPDDNVLNDFSKVIKQNESVPFFYGNVYKLQGRAKINIYPKRLSRFFLYNKGICHQCWCVKRTTYLSYGGFETTTSVGGDSRLYLRMLAGDRLRHIRLNRIVVCYKGGGKSTEVNRIRESQTLMEQLKKELFSAFERKIYAFLWAVWIKIKPIIYDRYLFIAWKKFQALRLHKETPKTIS